MPTKRVYFVALWCVFSIASSVAVLAVGDRQWWVWVVSGGFTLANAGYFIHILAKTIDETFPHTADMITRSRRAHE